MSNSGVPMVFMSIVRALKDEFVFDIVIFENNDMFYEKEFLSYGGKIFLLKRSFPEGIIKKVAWVLFKNVKNIRQFCSRNLDLSRYFAIHCFDEMFSSEFFRIAKKCSVKYRILHICAAFRAYPAKKNLKRYIVEIDRRKTLKLCTSIACSSDSTLKFNNYKNKGFTLFRTYNEKIFTGVIDSKTDSLAMAQIGTFSKRKNQLFTLHVLKTICETYPDTKLFLVGKEMEKGYKDLMDRYINDYCLSNNVFYLGTSPDRVKLSEDITCVVHPSFMEGSGNVLVETQVCGIHCFASDTLPLGYDLGNVTYLKLIPDLWAEEIIQYFRKFGNTRKPPIGKEKFTKSEFKKTLLKSMS